MLQDLHHAGENSYHSNIIRKPVKKWTMSSMRPHADSWESTKVVLYPSGSRTGWTHARHCPLLL